MSRVRWIDRSELLQEAFEGLGTGPVGVDMEADSFHHFRDRVCLVQVTGEEGDLVIDPLTEIDLEPLRVLLEDAGCEKILHGSDYDLRMFHRSFGFRVHGLFDTMVASRLVGERAFSLAALAEKFVGVSLDKRFQRADWSIRPLGDEMLDYAACDTRYLRDIRDRLVDELARRGRTSWAEEEFRSLEAPPEPEEAREPWRRVKGIGRMSPREHAMLRAVAELREQVAEETDRPRFRVMRDAVLVECVRCLVRSPDRFPDVRGVPRAWERSGRRRELREVVERTMALPDDELPRPEGRRRPPRDPEREARYRRIAEERDRIAGELELEPSVLANRGQLEALLDEGVGPPLREWQRGQLGPVFELL